MPDRPEPRKPRSDRTGITIITTAAITADTTITDITIDTIIGRTGISIGRTTAPGIIIATIGTEGITTITTIVTGSESLAAAVRYSGNDDTICRLSDFRHAFR